MNRKRSCDANKTVCVNKCLNATRGREAIKRQTVKSWRAKLQCGGAGVDERQAASSAASRPASPHSASDPTPTLPCLRAYAGHGGGRRGHSPLSVGQRREEAL